LSTGLSNVIISLGTGEREAEGTCELMNS
jgi:hypothetical protein